jgi:hypothetical protein
VELRVGYEKQGILVSHLLQSQKTEFKEKKQVIQSDQDMYMYELGWMRWKLLLYDLSLSMYKLF